MISISIEDYTSGANRLLQEIIYNKDYSSLKKILRPWRGESLHGYQAEKNFTALPWTKPKYVILKEEEYSADPSSLMLVLGIFCDKQRKEGYIVKERYISLRAHYQELESAELVDLDGILSRASFEQPVYAGQAGEKVDLVFPMLFHQIL